MANFRNRKQVMTFSPIFQLLMGIIIVSPCILWQLFWWKQSAFQSRDLVSIIDHHQQPLGLLQFQHQQQQQQQQSITSKLSNIEKKPTTAKSLLNLDFIRSTLLKEAPWAESHGADHNTYLGGALLYYAYAYAFQAKTIVVLGSGGGFIPRVLKQCQRDLEASGRPGPYNLYLIDAHLPQAGWGSTFYADNLDTIMRKDYNDIHYIFNLTDDAYPILKSKGITIDYLHVDADHGFEQSFKDFDNYANLLSDRAVISFHDTCRDLNRKCHVTGVAQTIDKVRSEMVDRGLQLMDAHYLYRGLAFAIKSDAPGLETPEERRINFCRNNAASLDKTSPGFTLNGDVGKLPSLGDFFQCNKLVDVGELLENHPCPFGKRRNSLKGICKDCIPGMKGTDCKTYKYASLRRTASDALSLVSMQTFSNQIAQMAAGWLATEAIKSQRVQHILELGPTAYMDPSNTKSPTNLARYYKNEKSLVVSNLLHDVYDATVIDPLSIQQPVWLDNDSTDEMNDSLKIHRKRMLPCSTKDAISEYKALLNFDTIDTFVCISCNDLVMKMYRNKEKKISIGEYLEAMFESVQTIVIGVTIGSVSTTDDDDNVGDAMNTLIEAFDGKYDWMVKNDVVITPGATTTLTQEKTRLVLISKTLYSYKN